MLKNFPLKVNQQAAAIVCRCLGFAGDQQVLSEGTRTEYAHFFDKPLDREHVAALTSLFAKEVPLDTKEHPGKVVAVV
jgi:hypothetical protein